jgi:hypothetical protein
VESLPLPISADLGKITIAAMDSGGQPTTLNLDPEIRFGSLQTIFDGERTVLIATSNGDAPQLDELLRWLSLDRGRWADLDGRAVISVPGSEPVSVPNRPSDLPDSDPESSDPSRNDWLWWGAGAVALVALAGALLIVLRTRTSTAATVSDIEDR